MISNLKRDYSSRRCQQACCAVLIFLYGIVVSDVRAGTGISSHDVSLDTRIGDGLMITMHRADASVLKNTGTASGIDEPLRVRGSNLELLRQLDELPLTSRLLQPTSGLIADGVTPLLFRVTLNEELVVAAKYKVSLTVAPAFPPYRATCVDVDLNDRLKVLDGGAWKDTSEFTLSPQEPEVWLLIEPVDSTDILNDAGGMAEVIMTVSRDQPSLFRRISIPAAKINFGVRKPPVVLVHGYNSGPETWLPTFTSQIELDRGSDFVISVSYGQADDRNTSGNLNELASELSEALWAQVEKHDGASKWSDSTRWAWTRYDVIGHSQGGVLLRFLCSSGAAPEFARFRAENNHYRGRFRRVVTIGSPHFGSTMLHLAGQIFDANIPLGHGRMEWFLKPSDRTRLLQPKFKVSEGELGTPTVRDLHKDFISDPKARIHLVGTTIFGAQYHTTETIWPAIYAANYLHWDHTWGESLIPLGSDGVVDLRSQLAIGTSARSSTISPHSAIAHAPAHWFPLLPEWDVWNTSARQTGSSQVGIAVRNLLNGPPSQFGPFPSYEESGSIYTEMDQVISKIHVIMVHLSSQFLVSRASLFGPSPESMSAAQDYSLARSEPEVFGDSGAAIDLTLSPLPSEPQTGAAEWSVVVYGPDGVSTQGVALTVSGALNENLRIDIDSSVIGQVVVSASYLSSTGVTVVGAPTVVFSLHPGSLIGIEIVPDHISLEAGPALQLDLHGIYDAEPQTLLFTDTNNTVYSTTDSTVAEVDAKGRVSLIAPGTATVFAVYSGIHTAAASVHVLGPPPTITSPANAIASVGIAFHYQITVDGTAESFLAEPIPPGLYIDVATGTITGAPTREGLFHISVGAANADGQLGRQIVVLMVTGSNEPPTDIGLSVSSVPALRPAGTVVGSFGTVDVNPFDTHTYNLVDGTGDTHNSLFDIRGTELETTAPIDPASTPTCSIRVRSTDSEGLHTEKSMILPVLGAPQIIKEPEDAVVFSGRDFAVAVDVLGHEPLYYQWIEGSTILSDEIREVLSLPTGSTGSRQFHVVISNTHGAVTSSVATVTIEPLSFDAWAAPYAAATGGSILPEGDINSNGIMNWYDYVFGTIPDETVESLPFLRRTPYGIALVHRRALNVLPVQFLYFISDDLQSWEDYFPPHDAVTDIPVDPVSEEREVLLPDQDLLILRMEVKQ